MQQIYPKGKVDYERFYGSALLGRVNLSEKFLGEIGPQLPTPRKLTQFDVDGTMYSFKPGALYQHFRGKYYRIISLATDTTTDRIVVVYQALYGNCELFTRPLNEFVEEVDPEVYEHEYKVKFPYPYGIHRFIPVGRDELNIPLASL